MVPRAILRARTVDGRDVTPRGPGAAGRSLAPEVAYQVFDMLADPDARRPMFGQDTPTHLPFPVAIKTGTTRAYTDNLALGTTPEYTVGAWAGNFDGRPTEGVMAMQGAAPLVRAAFVALAARFGLRRRRRDRPAWRTRRFARCRAGSRAPPAPTASGSSSFATVRPIRTAPATCTSAGVAARWWFCPEVVRPWARRWASRAPAMARKARRRRVPCASCSRVEGSRFSLDPLPPPGLVYSPAAGEPARPGPLDGGRHPRRPLVPHPRRSPGPR